MLDIPANLANNPLDKIVFLGTPEFAVSHLEHLLSNGENVIAVVTQQDKPANRGQKETPPPVKLAALKEGLPFYQPLSKQELEQLIQDLDPDILVVVAYGMMITPAIVNNYLCLNVHGSLLPKYRGAAPIQYAVLNGDAQSGVSIMVLDEKMDTGPVIWSECVDLLPTQTAGQLFDVLAALGPPALQSALYQLRRDREKTPVHYQDEPLVSYTKKLTREDGYLDLATMSPQQIVRKVKAFSPWPGTYVQQGELQVKIIDANLDDRGQLLILEVQPQNKKKMSYADYLRGYPALI